MDETSGLEVGIYGWSLTFYPVASMRTTFQLSADNVVLDQAALDACDEAVRALAEFIDSRPDLILGSATRDYRGFVSLAPDDPESPSEPEPDPSFSSVPLTPDPAPISEEE